MTSPLTLNAGIFAQEVPQLFAQYTQEALHNIFIQERKAIQAKHAKSRPQTIQKHLVRELANARDWNTTKMEKYTEQSVAVFPQFQEVYEHTAILYAKERFADKGVLRAGSLPRLSDMLHLTLVHASTKQPVLKGTYGNNFLEATMTVQASLRIALAAIVIDCEFDPAPCSADTPPLSEVCHEPTSRRDGEDVRPTLHHQTQPTGHHDSHKMEQEEELQPPAVPRVSGKRPPSSSRTPSVRSSKASRRAPRPTNSSSRSRSDHCSNSLPSVFSSKSGVAPVSRRQEAGSWFDNSISRPPKRPSSTSRSRGSSRQRAVTHPATVVQEPIPEEEESVFSAYYEEGGALN